MFLHVLVEGHWLQHDLLVDAAGVKQMQFAVLAPNGKAYMADVESCLARRNGKDVAVLDATEHFLAIPYPFLRNVTDGSTLCTLLHLCNQATFLLAILEQGIGIGMCTHIGKVKLHGDRNTFVWHHFLNHPQPRS